jgi:uncharacterized protein DUF3987/bifunctional DNA primase/polymerase-like protein
MKSTTRQTELALTLRALAAREAWKLVLLRGATKRPAGPEWRLTRDAAEIRADVLAGGNLGVLCGESTGLLVLDPDKPAWADMIDVLGQPADPWVETGSGRLHYYLAWVPDIPAGLYWQGQKIGEALRGPGQQMVVMPGSIHPDTKQLYRWLADSAEDPLPALPEAWLDYLRTQSNGGPPRGGATTSSSIPDDDPLLVAALRQPGATRRDDRVKCQCPGCHREGHDQHRDNACVFLTTRKWGCAVDRAHWRALGIALGQLPDEEPAPEREEAEPRETTASSWPEPHPAPPALLPVPPLVPAKLLPPTLASWVDDVAERVQCPPDFVAVGLVVSIATVIGRQLTIRPKRHDDWTVVPNLWGLVVGRPGVMKSPAMQASQHGLRYLIAQAHEEWVEAMKRHDFQVVEGKAKRAAIEKKIREAAGRGESTDGLREEYDAATIPEPPVECRFNTSDATVEKLGLLLDENPNGLQVTRDEIMGWLRSMERQGHENDRSFFQEAWSGTGSYTYDRIGRGTVHIKAACVSVLGGIQPVPLGFYLAETFKRGQDDGLIQRFQLLCYPDVTPAWKNIDRWPATETRLRLLALFQLLRRLDVTALGAHTESEHDDETLPFLRFTPEAQDRFDGWRADLECYLRSTRDHSVLVAHLSKFRSLVPSLALLFHVVRCVDRGAGGPVEIAALELALAWVDYLTPHAARVYQSVTNAPEAAAAALAAKIREGLLPSPFRSRALRLKGWAGLSTSETVEGAIEVLIGLGWLRRVEKPATVRGGRPTLEYEISPRIRRSP